MIKLNKYFFCVKPLCLALVMHSLQAEAQLSMSDSKKEVICDLRTDMNVYWPASALNKPAYLQTIIDPVFGTSITRIVGNPGDTIPHLNGQVWPGKEERHGYSKRQAWNADQSMIFLDRHYPHIWLDGNTYEPLFIRTFDKGNPDRPKRDLRWSHTEPHIMYYLTSSPGKCSLGKWDVVKDVLTELIDLSEYNYCSFGDGEGNFSADGTKAAVYALRPDGVKVIFVANVVTKTKEPDIEVTTLDNCTISPLGNYIVIDGDFSGGSDRIQVRKASDGRVLWTESRYGVPSHWDVQVDQNGDEVVAGVGKSSSFDGRVIKRRLSDGKITVIVDKGYASHTSGRNIRRPGWVYVTYNLRDESSYYPYQNEIVAVKLDGTRIERLGNIHSNSFTYVAEAHGSPSPDGLRVIFASDWDSGQLPIQAYVIDFRNKVLKK
jgi:hypothetical protein